MSISQSKSIPLGQLEHDPVILAMPGQQARLQQLDDLMASIPVHGLLQSLKVRISANGDRYLVTAGSRRLAALQRLLAKGGEIRGVKVTDDWPVPVVHSEETDAAAREQAVAENMQRVPPTVSAEVLAFAEMARAQSSKAIAAHFGVPVKRVDQRLKLAALHPELLAAVDAGKLTLETAQAFTVEPDQARQLAHFKRVANSSWELDPRRVRAAFTEELVAADGPLAKFIGEKAYKDAGGKLLDDVFGGGAWWISTDIIDTLRDERFAAWKEEQLAAGWAFVADIGEYNGYIGWDRRLEGPKPDSWMTGEGYTKEQKAGSGVAYWPDMSRGAHYGVVDAKKATPPKGFGKPAEQKVSLDLAYPGHQANAALNDALNGALQGQFIADPDMALRVLVASLHDQVKCGNGGWGNPLEVLADYGMESAELEGGDALSFEQGNTFAEVLKWTAGQDRAGLLRYLAELLAPGIDITGGGEDAAALIGFVAPKIPFDAEAYFAAVSKPFILLAWQDMTGEKLKGGKRDDFAALAAAKAREVGWLPPQLRLTGYTGPHFVKPEAADEDPDADDGDDSETPAIAAE